MAKIPHIDFKERDVLDGTEEIYTQNLNYDPKEQKFTVGQLEEHILKSVVAKNVGTKGSGVFFKKVDNVLQFRNISGDYFLSVKDDGGNIYIRVDPKRIGENILLEDLKDVPKPLGNNVILQWDGGSYSWVPAATSASPGAKNGLALTDGNYELGGELEHDTAISIKNFEFGIGKDNVSHKFTNTNPYWPNGSESSFLETENTATDTISYMGVTNSNFGSFSHIYSKKPQAGNFAYLQQSWAGTSMKTEDTDTGTFTEFNVGFTGTAMKCFADGNTATAGTVSVGTTVSEFKRVLNGSEINMIIKASQSSNELEILLKGLPVYSNDNNALSDNYPLDGLYRTPNGEVRIVTLDP